MTYEGAFERGSGQERVSVCFLLSITRAPFQEYPLLIKRDFLSPAHPFHCECVNMKHYPALRSGYWLLPTVRLPRGFLVEQTNVFTSNTKKPLWAGQTAKRFNQNVPPPKKRVPGESLQNYLDFRFLPSFWQVPHCRSFCKQVFIGSRSKKTDSIFINLFHNWKIICG